MFGELVFDGGSFQSCKGGAGGRPASCGYAIKIVNGKWEAVGIPLPPEMTNNQAEFSGLIHGLHALRAEGVRAARVLGDSQFVIRAMTGEYRIKNPGLLPLLVEARRAAEGMVVQYEWIRRDQNALADAMCRRAVEARAIVVDNLAFPGLD